ncbi:MAG: amino acid ABC transporter ATP-binding protein [Puniceicoccales bacterium]|jgi:ABC-type polar amino acid transport system ATPase subunit|nr:amino acid ABC transporter ATP-binding protein [Puniceicoccales bacterium]
MLEVKNLHCTLGTNEILQGISFTVADGEIVTVIGRSGTGKTTLLRVLCGLENISHGKVCVNGKKARHGDYGLVQQGCCLFEHMTVFKNVSYALQVVKKFPIKKAKAIALDMLTQFGLKDKVTAYPNSLSGGQKQRVAIARTLVMGPKVLLFDEPTSALDPEMTNDVVTMIKNIASQGIAILIVTHDLAMSRKISDRILFLECGKIVENRPTEEFFLDPHSEQVKNFLKNTALF